MKRFWIAFVVVAALLFGALAWLSSALRDFEGGLVEEAGGGTLVWRVQEEYAEEQAVAPLTLVMEGARPLLRDIVFGLARAARDNRIDGLRLEVKAVPGSWAQLQEMREAVAGFARSGKPVEVWLESGGEKEYLLALAGGRVTMAPEGNLMILGVTAEMSFLKGTLDKLGMEAEFVHVGRYKSAPEQLTRSEPTAPHREMIESVVEDHYARLVADVAAARGVGPERARAWIDAGLYDAEQALAAGLVDSIGPAPRDGEEDTVDLEQYALARRRGRAAGAVALVTVAGAIMPGESGRDAWSGPYSGSDTVIERLERAREDDGVGAVLLRVDSPGGSALASDLIWREVARVRERKPVIVSMAGYAASGGYYVSCGADSIFAAPGTLTGSIGVFAGKVDMTGFYGKLGISREFVTRGENALLFSDGSGFTEAQRRTLEAALGQFYARFVDKVAQGRRLPIADVERLAEGRVWTGAQGAGNGLVDGLGGLTRALTAAKRMMGLEPEELVSVVTYEEPLGWVERLLVRALRRSGAGARAGVPAGVPAVLADLPRAGPLADVPLLDGRPLALLPFRLELR